MNYEPDITDLTESNHWCPSCDALNRQLIGEDAPEQCHECGADLSGDGPAVVETEFGLRVIRGGRAAMKSEQLAELDRAAREISVAPCKGGPSRGDTCEMDGRHVSRCWRHHHEFDLGARLADLRMRSRRAP